MDLCELNVIFQLVDLHYTVCHLVNSAMAKSPDAVGIVEDYQKAKRENRLLLVDFITLDEYLSLLELCAKCLSRFGSRALLYLAAAVSDFHIPLSDLVGCVKIQRTFCMGRARITTITESKKCLRSDIFEKN